MVRPVLIAGAVWFDADDLIPTARACWMCSPDGFVMIDLARWSMCLFPLACAAVSVMVDINPDCSGKWHEYAGLVEIDCRNLCMILGV